MRPLLLSLLIFVGLVGAAEPPTLKGIAPGMNDEAIRAIHPEIRCEWIKSRFGCAYFAKYASTKSEALATLAGAPAIGWVIPMENGRARSVLVSLASSNFDDVRGAFVEKYGAPTAEEKSSIKNRMGATFDQVETRWVIGDHVLRLEKRGGSVDQMGVHLTSAQAMKEYERAKAGRRKEGAKDL